MLGRLSFVNRIVSKNLGLDENKVSDVNNFVFQELEAEMRQCQHPFIYVRGLGTFTLKVKTIERVLTKKIREYRTTRNRTGKNIRGTWEDMTASRRESILELFRMRRLIKGRLTENKKLRNAGKSNDDFKGQCLQAIE